MTVPAQPKLYNIVHIERLPTMRERFGNSEKIVSAAFRLLNEAVALRACLGGIA